MTTTFGQSLIKSKAAFDKLAPEQENWPNHGPGGSPFFLDPHITPKFDYILTSLKDALCGLAYHPDISQNLTKPKYAIHKLASEQKIWSNYGPGGSLFDWPAY